MNFAFTINGATTVVLRDFSSKETLRLFQDEKMTWICVAPTVIALILQYPEKDKYDLSTLKNIYYGGMPISSAMLREALKFFQSNFYQLLGGTEATIHSVLGPEDHQGKGYDH